jgi:hypothetical protein
MPIKMYVFNDGVSEFPLTVPVALAGKGDRLNMNTIIVRIEGKWQPLRDWLVSLPYRGELQPRIALLAQRHWWARNGRTFPLMRLPAEVRRMIYVHILGSKIYPDQDGSDVSFALSVQVRLYTCDETSRDPYKYDFLKPYKSNNWHVCGFEPSFPNFDILRLGGHVGQQIRQEALEAGWQATRKHFIDPWPFERVMLCQRPPNYNWIAKIELDFTLLGWFRFFGVGFDPRIVVWDDHRSRCPGLLRDITTLRDLRFHFPSPADRTNSNPWKQFKEHDYYTIPIELFGDDWDNHYNMPTRPCYKTAVDWVLTFAFQFIKHVPTVRLAGYVKKSVKDKWDYILATEYKHRNDKDWTSSYDHDEAMGRIIGQPAYATPECYCPLSCTDKPEFVHVNEFDFRDEYTTDMAERAEKYYKMFRRRATLFGPNADDLSVADGFVVEEEESEGEGSGTGRGGYRGRGRGRGS